MIDFISEYIYKTLSCYYSLGVCFVNILLKKIQETWQRGKEGATSPTEGLLGPHIMVNVFCVIFLCVGRYLAVSLVSTH